MSLRNSLLLLYSLILAVLVVALTGFYWAVERSIADQKLLRAAQIQVRDFDTFSAMAHRQLAATARHLVFGTADLDLLKRQRQQALENLDRAIATVRTELNVLQRQGKGHSAETKQEAEELGLMLNVRNAFNDMCTAADAVISRRDQIGQSELLTTIRDLDNRLRTSVDAPMERLKSDEMAVLLQRETAMAGHSQLFERLAIVTCLSTVIIVFVGSRFLRRAMMDLAKKEAAIAADRAKSEFLANMSHEIRTPMTAILGFTDILAQSISNPERVKTAEIIKRNGEHLLDIINDILDLSKIEAGQTGVAREPCSPSQIVAEVASLMQVRAMAKRLDLQVEFDGKVPETIQSSPLRLRQILINLVGNAIKFTEAGSVRLVTRLIDDKTDKPLMQFDVIDTGVGISQENLAKLFKAFGQVPTPRTSTTEGTGLGLAISRRLANMLDGDITVTSTVGKGSTFSATVATGPLEGVKMLELRAKWDSAAQIGLPAKEPKERFRLSGRILLVEDGPDNQRLINFLLKRAGAQVTVADNGIVAMDILLEAMRDAARPGGTPQDGPFDLVLMDMQMPEMDGYEVTRRLRGMGYRRPIVALTAHAMSNDRQKCLDAGCDDYVTKPIVEATLLQTLATHLKKASPAPAEPQITLTSQTTKTS
jgi:signal transduction histidine kinase/CheY-like chemotaxis protein